MMTDVNDGFREEALEEKKGNGPNRIQTAEFGPE